MEGPTTTERTIDAVVITTIVLQVVAKIYLTFIH